MEKNNDIIEEGFLRKLNLSVSGDKFRKQSLIKTFNEFCKEYKFFNKENKINPKGKINVFVKVSKNKKDYIKLIKDSNFSKESRKDLKILVKGNEEKVGFVKITSSDTVDEILEKIENVLFSGFPDADEKFNIKDKHVYEFDDEDEDDTEFDDSEPDSNYGNRHKHNEPSSNEPPSNEPPKHNDPSSNEPPSNDDEERKKIIKRRQSALNFLEKANFEKVSNDEYKKVLENKYEIYLSLKGAIYESKSKFLNEYYKIIFEDASDSFNEKLTLTILSPDGKEKRKKISWETLDSNLKFVKIIKKMIASFGENIPKEDIKDLNDAAEDAEEEEVKPEEDKPEEDKPEEEVKPEEDKPEEEVKPEDSKRLKHNESNKKYYAKLKDHKNIILNLIKNGFKKVENSDNKEYKIIFNDDHIFERNGKKENHAGCYAILNVREKNRLIKESNSFSEIYQNMILEENGINDKNPFIDIFFPDDKKVNGEIINVSWDDLKDFEKIIELIDLKISNKCKNGYSKHLKNNLIL